MSTIDEQIRLIKAKIQANQLAEARSQASQETAIATRDSALATLKEKFDLDNLQGVHAKLAELQDELNDRVKKLNETLDGLNN